MKANRRGGLGRGLGALIPTAPGDGGTGTAVATAPGVPNGVSNGTSIGVPAPGGEEADGGGTEAERLAPVPGARFAEIPVSSIEANPKQPRQVFDEEALDELKTSIEEVGFLQPIVVREKEAGKYELIMGERRWRAAQALGKEAIPAIVRETRDDAMLRDALLENIHRANLNPLEEAAAYQQLLEEFGATHEELAKRIGRSRPQISNTIRLLNLPGPVQRRVAAGVLSAGHARALLGLEDSEEQEALAHRIVAEGISVRATEELVALALSEGTATKKAAPQRRAKPHAPALSDLADRLSDRFDTRVKVDIGRRKGRITIEFATVDDLERIVGIIGVEDRAQEE
jgi:ParB family chromosome partitioning protein